MGPKNSISSSGRSLFQFLYTVAGLTLTLWLALKLQTGSAGLYLFFKNDVLTDLQRFAFILSFPSAYLVSLLVCGYALKLPRFDFFNRILTLNILVYSFIGFSFSALRLPLFSREVFLTEFFLSSILLVAFHILRHRLFPKILGVMPEVGIGLFNHYHSLDVISVNAESARRGQLDGIVAHLRGPIDVHTPHLLADLAQKHIPVYDANTLIETLWGRVPLADLSQAEMETFKPPEIYSVIKRIGDVVLIILSSPFLIILLLIIGIAIKLDSPGPMFFDQPRMGLNNTTFTMYKFRSMVKSSIPEHRFAEKMDKRVTRIGRLLRRLRLDELPQVWNVLRGDMSLIGPRPEQLEFTSRFDQLIPFYGFRHTIRPGITGWAQVMYGYAASDEQTRAKLEFDFFYIKHMSLWLDLVVLVKTFRTIILGSGSR